MTGTLHIEEVAIPESVAALTKLLQQRAIGVRFVINTTKKSGKDLMMELHGIGFAAIRAEHVLTTGGITRALIEREKLHPLFVLHDLLIVEFESVDCENPNAVVIGLAPEPFNYDKMNAAFQILMHGGSLIALNKAQSFASKVGFNIGPGAFVATLEYAANVQCTAIRAVMIGDDMRWRPVCTSAVRMPIVMAPPTSCRAGDELKHAVDASRDFVDAVEWVLQ